MATFCTILDFSVENTWRTGIPAGTPPTLGTPRAALEMIEWICYQQERRFISKIFCI